MDVDTVTTILREEGITEGGQLGAISTQELNNILLADAALYGKITTFRHLITGIYNERIVATDFQLIDLESGEKLWEDEEKIAKRQLATDSEAIKDALLQNVASRIVEKWAKLPLLPESKEIVATHLATLPWGPNKEGYPTWLWSNPNMKIGASVLYGFPHIIGLQVAAWQQNLGFQANLGILTKSVNLLYSPSYNRIRRYYGGLRLGSDTVFGADFASGNELGLSIFGGIEFLRWKYGGILPNNSFSINFGFTLTGLTGPYLTVSNGLYFR